MHVSSNLLSTLSGAIADSTHPGDRLGSEEDYRRMLEIRSRHDVVIHGAGTLRAGIPRHWVNRAKTRWLPSVILSRTGKFDAQLPVFSERRKDVWFCLPNSQKSVSNIHGIPVIHADTEHMAQVMETLHQTLGFERLLVEGGGDIFSQCIRERVIDTIYLTLHTSFLDDDGAPKLFRGLRPKETGFGVLHAYRIHNLEYTGSEIFLTLRKSGEPRHGDPNGI